MLGGVYYGDSLDGRLSLMRDRRPTPTRSATRPRPPCRSCVAGRAQAVNGKTALVGGPSAEIYDTKQALRADAKLIVPLALGLVFLIVAACCAR